MKAKFHVIDYLDFLGGEVLSQTILTSNSWDKAVMKSVCLVGMHFLAHTVSEEFTRPVNYEAAFSPKRSRVSCAIKLPTLMPTKQYHVNTKGNKIANKAYQKHNKWNLKSQSKAPNGRTNAGHCVETSQIRFQSSAELSEEFEPSSTSSGGTKMCVPLK